MMSATPQIASRRPGHDGVADLRPGVKIAAGPAAARRLLLPLLAVAAAAAAQFDEPLPPEEAFPLIAFAEAGSVVVSFQVPDGYYLYRHRFGFESLTGGVALGTPELPEGRRHVDEFFGTVEIYRGDFQIRIPYRRSGAVDEMRVRLELQGCADIGYCYLPVSWEKRVRLASGE